MQKNISQKIKELVQTPDLKEQWQQKRQKLLDDKIDVTAFMVWLVSNYPASIKRLEKEPEYANTFK